MGHCGGGAVRTATSTGRLRQLGTKRVRVVATQRVSKNPEKILNTRMKKKRGTENRKEKQKKNKKKGKRIPMQARSEFQIYQCQSESKLLVETLLSYKKTQKLITLKC